MGIDFTAMDSAFDLLSTFDLAGRTALVTGGGTGIGEATAKVLAGRGCDVAVETAIETLGGLQYWGDILTAELLDAENPTILT